MTASSLSTRAEDSRSCAGQARRKQVRGTGLVLGIALLIASTSLGTAAFATTTTNNLGQRAGRGHLLSAQRVAHFSRAETARQVEAVGFPTRWVRHGVDAFRLTYATVGLSGGRTTATGLLVLPRTRSGHVRTVSYTHGTLAARADAPSRSLDSLGGASALLFGGAGYATVEPDYLGLGYGPGPHPFMQVQTEVSASLDMLRAAHVFAARRHRKLDAKTMVTGFSQGAQAAMALGRALQRGAGAHLRLGALAAMSGPYDIEHAEIPAMLAGHLDASTSSYYTSYLMHSWQQIYHVYNDPADVWRDSWGDEVAHLFDGNHDDIAILRALPRRLSTLFTPSFLASLAQPRGRLALALRVNDRSCRWRPRAPVRLYVARGDRQVTPVNSTHCAAQLRSKGVRARLVEVGSVDHFPSAVLATPRVLHWFDRIVHRGPDQCRIDC